MPEPPQSRPAGQPWPTYPMTFRVSSAHEEAGERVYAVSTKAFLGDENGNVRALRLVDVVFEGGRLTEIEGTEREIPAELVLLAMASPVPRRLDRPAGRRPRPARQRGARRFVHVVGAGVFGGRRRPRPVAHRVGDRRGSGGGGGVDGFPHRVHHPARADPPHGAAARGRGAWTLLEPAMSREGRRARVEPAICLHLGPATPAAAAHPGAGVRRHGCGAAEHEPRQPRGPRRGLSAGARGVRRQRARGRHRRRPPGPEDPAEHVRRGPGHAAPGAGVDDHHPRRPRRHQRRRHDVQGIAG